MEVSAGSTNTDTELAVRNSPHIWELWWEKGSGGSNTSANECVTKDLKLLTSCSGSAGMSLSAFLSLVSKKEKQLSLCP